MSERGKFEKWWLHSDTGHTNNKEILWAAWQAALSTRKPCGFGVADKDGDLLDMTPLDKEEAEELVKHWNSDQRDCMNPHRVVELFYEEQS